jgi:hypothetical protein
MSPILFITFMLRFGGTVLSLAAIAVFLPRETMQSLNAQLGLAPLPDVPIVYYLARSTSALYALRGTMYFLAAADPVRYRPLIVFIGVTNIAFGIALAGIGATAGIPMWWTGVEGPFVVVTGVVLLVLVRFVPQTNPWPRTDTEPQTGPDRHRHDRQRT